MLYEGASQLGGWPIVVIATPDSDNVKTGPMWQTWILRRDVHPMAAVDDQSDAGVCGDCKHRPVHLGTCYVQLAWAPSGIWRAYREGHYTRGLPKHLTASIRFGAYGDPVAAPFELWSLLASLATKAGFGWTGYTHQWRSCSQQFKFLLMASVDTLDEQREAQQLGWRTFRVKTPEEAQLPSEITCPASAEAGHRTTCAECLLCQGTSRPTKDICIRIHGSTQLPFYRQKQLSLFGV